MWEFSGKTLFKQNAAPDTESRGSTVVRKNYCRFRPPCALFQCPRQIKLETGIYRTQLSPESHRHLGQSKQNVKTGRLKCWHLFSHESGAQKSEIKLSAELTPATAWEGSVPGLSSGPGHHLPSSHTVTVWGFLGGAMKAWCIPSCPWHELMFNLCWHGGGWWGRNRLIATYEVVRVGGLLLQGPHQTSFPGELVEGAGWPVGDNLKRHCPFFCQLFFWLRMLGIPFSSSVPWKTCMS